LIRAKICGLKDVASVEACASAGATYIGLNFFEPSARFVAPGTAAMLAAHVPVGIAKVGLTVDASDAELDAVTRVVPLDMLQLHGRETPGRVAEVRSRYGLPVMKVVAVARAEDLAALPAYEKVSDQVMVDAKAPKGDAVPGGHGVPFDWSLVAGRRWAVPWMLAGGLTPRNVGEAIRLTGATQVDVASGVETEKGVKDAGRIAAFMDAVRGAKGPVPVL